jgi:hypothetical protein
VNVDKSCYETEFGARNRITDMLHVGLPVVSTRGSEVAEEVEQEGLGVVVPRADPSSLAEGILSMRDERVAGRFRARGRKYSRSRWVFGAAVAPMLEWVSAAALAPDNDERFRCGAQYVDPLEGAADLEAREAQTQRVEDDLRAIHATRAFRLYKRLKNLVGKVD